MEIFGIGIGTLLTCVTVGMIVILYGWNWYKKRKDQGK